MYQHRVRSVLAITAAFMLGGCSSMSRQEVSTVTGAAVGAGIGGVVGHEVGKK